MEQQDLDFLTQQKIELSLQMKTKRFDEELSVMRRLVDDLRSEIFSLRQKVDAAGVAPQHTVRVSTDDEEPVVRPEVSQSQMVRSPVAAPTQAAPAPEVKKESHPRQGNFTSADVDIQKFFNFSGKR